jgi:hypothetical protein
MITLITPTRDRPEAFALCEKYMARQTYDGPKQWIVVDDGDVPIKPTLGQTHIRRPPSTIVCTLPRNLLEAVEHVVPSSETILFIEDDDWYAPDYVKSMVEFVKGYEIAGLGYHRYYNVLTRMWRMENNMNAAGLCVTAINGSLLGFLKAVCETAAVKDDYNVDVGIWRAAQSENVVISEFITHTLHKNVVRNDGLSVGIKAMPGRNGLASGHGTKKDFLNCRDDDCNVLKTWIGDDVEAYMRFGLPHLPRTYKPKPPPAVTVSVVIHDQLGQFRKFLVDLYAALHGAGVLERSEIIVTDNASTDGTPFFRLENEIPIRGMPASRWVRCQNKIEVVTAHENAKKMARGARFVTVGEDLRVPAL